MRLVERDYIMMREIDRWRCPLGRQIRHLASFSGQRATDRRLKVLIDNQFIERKRVIYGIPSIYSLTYKSKKLLGYTQRKESIKLEQVAHDIHVLDTVIYFVHKQGINLADIKSEKELHSQDGFSYRKHRPDFTFSKDNKSYCVEIELNLKAKARFEKNIKDNFLNYDIQEWIIPNSKVKIRQILKENYNAYPNIEMISLEEVTDYVSNL